MSLCNICDQLVAQVKPIGNELQSILEKLENQLKNNVNHAEAESAQWICDKCDLSVRNRYLLKVHEESKSQMLQMQLDNEKLRNMLNQLQQDAIRNSISADRKEIKDSIDIKNAAMEIAEKSAVPLGNVASAKKSVISSDLHEPTDSSQLNEVMQQANSFNANSQLQPVTNESSLQQLSTSLTKIICQSKYIITNDKSSMANAIVNERSKPIETTVVCALTMTPTQELNTRNTKQTSVSSCAFPSSHCSDLESTTNFALDKSNDEEFILKNNNSAENTFDDSLKQKNSPISLTNVTEYYYKDETNHYVCKLCTDDNPARFSASYYCARHIRKIHIGLQFVCDLCDRRFYFIHLIRIHYESQHLIEPPSVFRTISTTAITAQEYNRQINDDSMPFNLDSKISEKLKKFYGIVNELYTCQLCPVDVSFKCKTRNSIDQHLGVEHLKIIFACQLCDMKYKSKNGLSIHMKAMHCMLQQKILLNAESCNDTREIDMNSANSQLQQPVTNESNLQQLSTSLTKTICQSKYVTTNDKSSMANALVNEKSKPIETTAVCALTMTPTQELNTRNIEQTSISSCAFPSSHCSDLESTTDFTLDKSNDEEFILKNNNSAENTFDDSLKQKNGPISLTNVTEYYYKDETNYYVCKLCTARFPASFNCTRHIRKIHIGLQFVCDLCDKRFYFFHLIRSHYESKHSIEPPSVIRTISTTAITAQEYNRQINEDSMPFNLDSEILDKLKKFYGIVNELYTCQLCPVDASFKCKTRNSIDQHLGVEHLKIIFACKLCDMKYKSKNGLSAHVKAMHCTLQQKKLLNAESCNDTREIDMNSADNCDGQTAAVADLENAGNLITELGEEQQLNKYILSNNIAPLQTNAENMSELKTEPLLLSETKPLNINSIFPMPETSNTELDFVTENACNELISLASLDNNECIQMLDDKDAEDEEVLSDESEILKLQSPQQKPPNKKQYSVEYRNFFKQMGNRYYCRLCKTSKKYKHYAGVIYHIKTHNRKVKYKCNECNVMYTAYNDMRQHYKSQHKLKQIPLSKELTVMLPFSSSVGHTIKNKRNLKTLMQKSGNLFFCRKCSEIGKSYKSKYYKTVRRHIEEFHVESFLEKQQKKKENAVINQKYQSFAALQTISSQKNRIQALWRKSGNLYLCNKCDLNGKSYTCKCYETIRRHIIACHLEDEEMQLLENQNATIEPVSSSNKAICQAQQHAEEIFAIKEENQLTEYKYDEQQQRNVLTESEFIAENNSNAIAVVDDIIKEENQLTEYIFDEQQQQHSVALKEFEFSSITASAQNQSCSSSLAKQNTAANVEKNNAVTVLQAKQFSTEPSNGIVQLQSLLQQNILNKNRTATNRIKSLTYNKFYRKGTSSYYCRLCKISQSYRQPGGVIQHIKSTHLGVKYKCNECNEMYRTLTGMRRHYKRQHNNKQLPSPKEITIMVLSSNSKTGQTNSQTKYNFKKLMRKSGNLYVCNICAEQEISYTSKYYESVRRHLSANHQEACLKQKLLEEEKQLTKYRFDEQQQNAAGNQSDSSVLTIPATSTELDCDNQNACKLKQLSLSQQKKTSNKTQQSFSEREKPINYIKFYKTVGKNYYCVICKSSKKYSNRCGVIYHLKSVHFGVKYKCRECSKIYMAYHYIRQHYKERHNTKQIPSPQQLKMMEMPYTSKYNESVRRHINASHQEAGLKQKLLEEEENQLTDYRFDEQQQNAGNQSDSSVLTIPATSTELDCDNQNACKLKQLSLSQQKKTLNKTQQSSSEREKPINYIKFYKTVGKNYYCVICKSSKKYSNRCGVIYHLKSVHFGVKYKCRECSEMYMAYHDIRQHYKKRHNTKQIPSPQQLKKMEMPSCNSKQNHFFTLLRKSGKLYCCNACALNGKHYTSKCYKTASHHIKTCHLKAYLEEQQQITNQLRKQNTANGSVSSGSRSTTNSNIAIKQEKKEEEEDIIAATDAVDNIIKEEYQLTEHRFDEQQQYGMPTENTAEFEFLSMTAEEQEQKQSCSSLLLQQTTAASDEDINETASDILYSTKNQLSMHNLKCKANADKTSDNRSHEVANDNGGNESKSSDYNYSAVTVAGTSTKLDFLNQNTDRELNSLTTNIANNEQLMCDNEDVVQLSVKHVEQSNEIKEKSSCKRAKQLNYTKFYRKVAKNFYCVICKPSQKYLNRSAMIYHLKNVHFGEKFKCTECNGIYMTYYNIRQHYQKLHNIKQIPSAQELTMIELSGSNSRLLRKNGNVYFCSACALEGKHYKSKCYETARDHLKDCHLKAYQEEQQQQQQQHNTMESANVDKTLENSKHTASDNDSEQQTFSEPINYSEFYRNVENNYYCKICKLSKEYAHRSSVIYHLKTMHFAVKYKCTECNEAYTVYHDIRQHYQSQHKTMQIPLPKYIKIMVLQSQSEAEQTICKKRNNFQTLIRKSDNLYLCNICTENGKSFASKHNTSTKRHIMKFHEEAFLEIAQNFSEKKSSTMDNENGSNIEDTT